MITQLLTEPSQLSQVKDGKCMIRQGAHGQLEVAAVPPSGDAAGSKPRTQFVISQSREDWELWKQYVRPGDCVMRVRQAQPRHVACANQLQCALRYSLA